MATNTSYQDFDLSSVATGGTIQLALSGQYNYYTLSTAITASGAITVTDDGSPVQGNLFDVQLLNTITIGGGGSFSFFGQSVAGAYLQEGTRMVAIYDGSAYKVWVSPSFLAGGFIQGSDIASSTISFDRLVSLTSGNILVGNGSNVAASVAMSGDATISNTGALTIANNAITAAKINANAVTTAKILDANVTLAKLETAVQNQLNALALQNEATTLGPVSSASTLTLNSVPITIVPAVSGQAYQATGGIINYTYGTTPYATATTVQVKAAGASAAQLQCNVLGAGSSVIAQFNHVVATGVSQLVSNAALQLTAAADPTAGDGTWTYYVFYKTYNI